MKFSAPQKKKIGVQFVHLNRGINLLQSVLRLYRGREGRERSSTESKKARGVSPTSTKALCLARRGVLSEKTPVPFQLRRTDPFRLSFASRGDPLQAKRPARLGLLRRSSLPPGYTSQTWRASLGWLVAQADNAPLSRGGRDGGGQARPKPGKAAAAATRTSPRGARREKALQLQTAKSD